MPSGDGFKITRHHKHPGYQPKAYRKDKKSASLLLRILIVAIIAVGGYFGFKYWRAAGSGDIEAVYEDAKSAVAKVAEWGESTGDESISIEEAEKLTFDLVNEKRVESGAPETIWDDNLYIYSKIHTQEMADCKVLFHSPDSEPYGENCWGGMGDRISLINLPEAIVDGGWMQSPLHKAWMLYPPLKHVALSIVIIPNGEYASFTFWWEEAGEGPALVQQLSKEYGLSRADLSWTDWLISKGYLKP